MLCFVVLLLGASCSLSVVRCSLFVVCCCSSLRLCVGVRCLLFVVCRLMCIRCWLSLFAVACCRLFVGVGCSLFALLLFVCCSLRDVRRSLLFVVYWLLYFVSSFVWLFVCCLCEVECCFSFGVVARLRLFVVCCGSVFVVLVFVV